MRLSHQKRKKPHPKMANKPKQTKKRKTQSIQNTSQNSTPWATPPQPNSYGVQKASHILPCWTNTPFPCWTNTEHFSMLQAYWKYFLCVVSPLLLNLIVRQVMKLIGQPLEWIVKSVSISKILLFWCVFTKNSLILQFAQRIAELYCVKIGCCNNRILLNVNIH